MNRTIAVIAAFFALVPVLGIASGPALADPKPVKEPARIDLAVSPDQTSPGGEVRVTVRLSPKPGIKINRYPRITLKVAEIEGLVGAGQASVGNTAPPPPDKLDKNYFKSVDPVVLTLAMDAGATPGTHEIPAKLKYYYCVGEFCAPKKETVTIPVTVR